MSSFFQTDIWTLQTLYCHDMSVDYSAIWRDRPFRSRFRIPSVANVGDFMLMIGLGDDGDSDMWKVLDVKQTLEIDDI